MKHTFIRRMISLTAAGIMLCNALCNYSNLNLTAKAIYYPWNFEQTDVMVEVAGDAVLAQYSGDDACEDFLETDKAAFLTAQCEAVQQSVQADIRRMYPELEVTYSYTTLFNGFSCNLPANLIEKVEALPDVVSVTENDVIEVPAMSSDQVLNGFPSYYDITNCTGEGQVIAVIDTELDITHPMFAPLEDDIQTKISRSDIERKINKKNNDENRRHMYVDPDRAYVSNKLPFVLDYYDLKHPYDGVKNIMSYHGTHVSGIAAGNAYKIDEGRTICGIAKDAQLMFFAVGTEWGSINMSAAMAALNDAVEFGADVINMSWGKISEEKSCLTSAIKTAETRGITVCVSAGNTDNGTYSQNRINTPEYPDVGMMDDKADCNSPVLIIGSADSPRQTEAGVFWLDHEKIIYRPTRTFEGEISFLSKVLEPGEYEYVDCGTGSEEDYSVAMPEGRIAVVQPGNDFSLYDAAGLAKRYNAVGVIVIDKKQPDGEEYLEFELTDYTGIRFALVTYEDGQKLLSRDCDHRKITITGENVIRDEPTRVSDFSSWGVKNSLELRPDLVGIGGGVSSAGYYGATYTMSGTSMSSPYVAGCAAVLREYLEKTGCPYKKDMGKSLPEYIRLLMMNSAVPFQEDGLYVTPRRQGAGLVSVDKAAATKVIMFSNRKYKENNIDKYINEAKVNLFDQIGRSFEFTIFVQNNTDEDVTFENADICLTTDGCYYDTTLNCDVLKGQQKLNCTTDFQGAFHLEPREIKEVTIHVNLDENQCAELSEKFKNGFFVEGYTLLSGAENSSDISIPMLGFYGDWRMIPVYMPDKITLSAQFGENGYQDGLSLTDMHEMYSKITSRMESDHSDSEELYSCNPMSYATEEEYNQMYYGTEECWISPNDDFIADRVCNIYMVKKRRFDLYVMLKNAAGQKLLNTEMKVKAKENGDGTVLYDLDKDILDPYLQEEGDYQLIGYANIRYGERMLQIFKMTIHVDKTKPQVESSIVQRDGRMILTVTASDNRELQGITVTGCGRGGLAGSYKPAENANEEFDVKENWFYFIQNNIFDCKGYYYSNSFILNDIIEKVPYILRKMIYCTLDSEDQAINFYDAVPFTQNSFGEYQVEYDVTDLSNCSVTVLDKAYNFVEIQCNKQTAKRFTEQTGKWINGQKGIYTITENGTISFKSFWDGSVTEYSYQLQDDLLILRSDKETITYRTLLYNGVDEWTSVVLRNVETGSVETFSFENETNRHLFEEIRPVEKIMELLTKHSEEKHNKKSIRTDLEVFDRTTSQLNINVIYKETDGKKVEWEHYRIYDLFKVKGDVSYINLEDTQKADTPTENQNDDHSVYLYQTPKTSIQAGLYYLREYGAAFLFHDDGCTGEISYGKTLYDLFIRTIPDLTDDDLLDYQTSGAFKVEHEQEDRSQFENIPFCYSLDQNGKLIITFPDSEKQWIGIAYKTTASSRFEFERNPYEEPENNQYSLFYKSVLHFELVSNDPEKNAQRYSAEEIYAAAASYARSVKGRDVSIGYITGCSYNETTFSCSVQCEFETVNSNWIYLDFYVNPFTLECTDWEGNPIDLQNPPKLPDDAVYSIAELEQMAINHFTQITQTKLYRVDSQIMQDGHVSIEIENTSYDICTYTIDPVTGIGFDQDGEEVNLPETGHNEPETRQIAVAAVLMMTAGIAFMGIVLRRKRSMSCVMISCDD